MLPLVGNGVFNVEFPRMGFRWVWSRHSGSPWFFEKGWIEWIAPRYTLALFTEGYFGLGHLHPTPLSPFLWLRPDSLPEDRSRRGALSPIEYFGDLLLRGWHTVYARNCMIH